MKLYLSHELKFMRMPLNHYRNSKYILLFQYFYSLRYFYAEQIV